VTLKQSLDTAKCTMRLAQKHGAEEAAITVDFNHSVQIEVRGGSLTRLQDATQRRLSLAVLCDQRYSVHSTSNLDRNGLEAFVRNAVQMTRHLARDQFRTLPDCRKNVCQRLRRLDLIDPLYEQLTLEDRVQQAEEMECTARAQNKRVISTSAQVTDSHSRAVKLHSNGFVEKTDGTIFTRSVNVAVKDRRGGRPEDSSYGTARHLKDLPSMTVLGKEAANRALAKIGQRKVSSGTYDLLVENRIASRFLWPLIGAINGRALQFGNSFALGKFGERVASELLTVTDDPFVPGGANSRLFDNEGVASQIRTIIEKGILKNLYIDSYYGRKLKMQPTTGSPTNILIESGNENLANLIKSLRAGVLVTNFIGGDANVGSGDFSFGINGFMIRRGRVEYPVNEMNVSGNFRNLWHQLESRGNDVWLYGPVRTPSLHFRSADFSGL
jgi:PmbA protein